MSITIGAQTNESNNTSLYLQNIIFISKSEQIMPSNLRTITFENDYSKSTHIKHFQLYYTVFFIINFYFI